MNLFYLYLGTGVLLIALCYGRARLKKDIPEPVIGYNRHSSKSARYTETLLFLLLLVLIWPVLAWITISEMMPGKTRPELQPEKRFAVEPEHLQEKLSLASIEVREMVEDPLNAVPRLPFGHLNQAWCNFLETVAEDDEIWSFSTEWENPWGRAELRAGYALVRNGVPGRYFLTDWKVLPKQK